MLTELAEIAKDVEAELARARTSEDEPESAAQP